MKTLWFSKTLSKAIIILTLLTTGNEELIKYIIRKDVGNVFVATVDT